MEVYIDDEAKLTLHGLQQHYVKLKDSEKNRKLFELLDVLEFNQVSSQLLPTGVWMEELDCFGYPVFGSTTRVPFTFSMRIFSLNSRL
jgi:hypothetical protein